MKDGQAGGQSAAGDDDDDDGVDDGGIGNEAQLAEVLEAAESERDVDGGEEADSGEENQREISEAQEK